MSRESVLAAGRAFEFKSMSETVTVFTSTYGDPAPGTIEPVVIQVTVYASLTARVKYPTLTVSDRDSGSQAPAVQSVEVHLPSGTTGIRTDQFVVVLTSTVDQTLVGRRYRIAGNGQAGQTTALRVPVEEVS